jgi:hypothetical protein
MSSSIRTSGPAGIPPHGHATEREMLRESVKHDYATEKSGGIVPLDRRRRLWSMAALWLTMNCGFGEIFIGFEYHQAGFTLLKSVAVSLIGCALYFCYAVPAAYLGTRTGQTHSLLARSVFGRVGAVVVATCLLVMGTGFVGFQSSITAQIFDGLFSWGHLLLVGIAVSIFCILNNVLGFSGVVAWARYVVTPIVVLWIVYMMVKALATEPSSVLGAHPPVVAGLSVWQGIGAMLGVCVWGDEPDFWRFGKPRFWWPAGGYAFGLIVGDILFTLAGWVMAQLAGAGDFSHSVMYVTTYSLFGLTWLAFIVAGVSQMAAQDGNYYAAINAPAGDVRRVPPVEPAVQLRTRGGHRLPVHLVRDRRHHRLAGRGHLRIRCGAFRDRDHARRSLSGAPPAPAVPLPADGAHLVNRWRGEHPGHRRDDPGHRRDDPGHRHRDLRRRQRPWLRRSVLVAARAVQLALGRRRLPGRNGGHLAVAQRPDAGRVLRRRAGQRRGPDSGDRGSRHRE